MAEMFGPLNTLAFVQQQGEMGRARAQENRLAQLASQSYSTPLTGQTELLGQMAAVNPRAAQAQQQQFQSQDDRQQKTLVNAARLLTSAPEQYRPNVYQQMREGLSRFIPNLPEQYDDTVGQAAQAIAQAYGGAGDAATPSGFRQFQMTAQAAGLKEGTPEYQQAARIALGQEGRAATGGFGFREIVGADGRTRIARTNPRTGATEIYDEQTGQFSPLGGIGALGGQVGQGVMTQAQGTNPSQETILSAANAMIANGVPEAQVDSWVQQQLSQPAATFAPTARPGIGVSRTKEEEAGAVESARQAAQLQYLPQEQAIRTQAAITQAAGTAQAKGVADRESARLERQRDANETLTLLEEAEKLLPNSISGRFESLGAQGAANFGLSTEGARASARLKVIGGLLTSKTPRMQGPQSDKDVQLYREMAGDLANENLPWQTRLSALQGIRSLNQKYAAPAQAAPAQSTASGWGIQRVD